MADNAPRLLLPKDPEHLQHIVTLLQRGLQDVKDEKIRFSELKRAYGTALLQGTDRYRSKIEGANEDATKAVQQTNTAETGVRGKANFAPRNQSHHGTGLKIITNPTLDAAAKHGAPWLSEYLDELDKLGYQGYGDTGQGFISLPERIHIPIAHEGDAFTAFMGSPFGADIDPRKAARAQASNIDGQIIASTKAAENKYMARQRLLAGQYTGNDPIANPTATKAALNALGITSQFMDEEVLRQTGMDSPYQLTLSPKDLKAMESDPRGWIRSGRPYEIWSNPSIFGVTPGGAAIQQAGKLINKNRLGALTGAGFGGADREVGKKLGQGDYRGAAVQLGTNATIGAASEAALKAGSKSLLKALAKRAPALASRIVAGSAASGGLLAPALAAYGLYDIADGVVEGATGKGVSQRVVDSGALNTGSVSLKPATAQQKANYTNISNRMNGRKPAAIPATSKPRIKADLSGKLSAAQIRTFQAGGGQAAMLRDGLTREQVIERGSALLLKQKYG